MKANRAMREVLKKYGIDLDAVPPMDLYPIWQGEDALGHPYWGVSNFCGMGKPSGEALENLSRAEWDGNDTYIGTRVPSEIPALLEMTVRFLKAWEEDLVSRFPDTVFYVFSNYDDGRWEAVASGEEPSRGTVSRFWAVREGQEVVDFSDFEDWETPALMAKLNAPTEET